MRVHSILAAAIAIILLHCAPGAIHQDQSKIVRVTASSTLKDARNRYAVENLTDLRPKSWCEGKPGPGIGESLTIETAKPTEMRSFHVKNGFGDSRYFARNNRVKDVKISSGGKEQRVQLRDVATWQSLDLKAPLRGTKFKITIMTVYGSGKDNDTCLAEIGLQSYAAGLYKDKKPAGPGTTFTEVEVRFGSSIFTLGKNGSLKGRTCLMCNASNPIIKGSWSRLPSGGIKIDYVYKDAAYYIPDSPPETGFKTGKGSLTLNDFSEKKICCDADGNPAVDIKWTK